MKPITVVYRPPNSRKHHHISMGPRQLALLECLRRHDCSRLDMLAWGRPWLALSAPQTVASLRKRGVVVESTMETTRNAEGVAVRFARYHLEGSVVRVERGRR